MLSDLMSAHRPVTVVGVGGMGKTRLVIETCSRLPSDFDGGVWFIDLAVAQSDRAVVDELASLFGVQPAPGRSVEDRIVEYLELRTAILIFDNCEHVMRSTAVLIDRLLHACPMLSVVATSREELLLRGEHVMALTLSSEDGGAAWGDSTALFIRPVGCRRQALRHLRS